MIAVRFSKFCVKIFAVILIVAFVALNRQQVDFYYSPLNENLTLPLWLIGLVIYALGFLIGALLLWLNNQHYKKELKITRRKLEQAEKDRETLGETLHDHQMKALDKPEL